MARPGRRAPRLGYGPGYRYPLTSLLGHGLTPAEGWVNTTQMLSGPLVIGTLPSIAKEKAKSQTAVPKDRL